MRLADFIEENTAPILAEWTAFAGRSGPAGQLMDAPALRDHIAGMLKTMVADLRSSQTDAQQAAKSKGDAPTTEGHEATPAEVHGAGRAESGFTIGEMVSEYRALRASVVRLWSAKCTTLDSSDFDDLLRFNETIDQAVAESVTRYTTDIERSKEMFLAILGHDLRNPLGAVIMASQFMLDTGGLVEPNLALTTRIVHAGRRMNVMVGELLDFTRSRLGSSMPLTPKLMDLGREAGHAVDEMRSAHPECVFHLNTSGDLNGTWDCPRLTQLLSNLLGNAAQHGTPRSTISLTARGELSEVVIQVHNRGPSIPEAEMGTLFSPFKRLGKTSDAGTGSLGLGLYIVERIVSAHGGKIEVNSTDSAGTFFTVRLPRNAPVDSAPIQ